MNSDQTQETWRKTLVRKLQDRYGLSEDESKLKPDQWLQWVNDGAAEAADERR